MSMLVWVFKFDRNDLFLWVADGCFMCTCRVGWTQNSIQASLWHRPVQHCGQHPATVPLWFVSVAKLYTSFIWKQLQIKLIDCCSVQGQCKVEIVLGHIPSSLNKLYQTEYLLTKSTWCPKFRWVVSQTEKSGFVLLWSLHN